MHHEMIHIIQSQFHQILRMCRMDLRGRRETSWKFRQDKQILPTSIPTIANGVANAFLISISMPYIFCAAAVFRLHPKEEQNGRAYAQLIFGFAFLFSMWALGGSGKDALYWGFLLMMFSVPIYVASKAQSADSSTEPTTEELAE